MYVKPTPCGRVLETAVHVGISCGNIQIPVLIQGREVGAEDPVTVHSHQRTIILVPDGSMVHEASTADLAIAVRPDMIDTEYFLNAILLNV